jgi:hypothetical protein
MNSRTSTMTCPTCLAPPSRQNPCNTRNSQNQVQITAATHNYERGMSLWEVQKLLGHDRPATTVSYLATAHADPEKASLAAAGRAVQRLTMDKGNLR